MSAKIGGGDVERVDPNETKDWTSIRIEAPLPLGVAGALMQLIGQAWPEAVIVPVDSNRWGEKYGLSMKVPPNKGARSLSHETTNEIRADVDDDAVAMNFLGFDIDDESNAWLKVAPPEDLCLFLGEIGKRIIESNEKAVNYIEWAIRTKDGDEYVLAVGRSKGQLPGALHKEAQAEVERLRALLDKHGIPHEEF